MDRRKFVLAGAAAVLETGCGSSKPQLGAPYYFETIEALAATQDWQRIFVFGRNYDYELVPPRELVDLLTGPLRTRLVGDFRQAHLRSDNSLALNVLLTLTEQDMSDAELQAFARTSPQLPGKRLVFDQRLRLQRYAHSKLDKTKLGVQPTNQKYVIDIVGDAEMPPSSLSQHRTFSTASLVVLIPIFIIWYVATQKGMPLK